MKVNSERISEEYKKNRQEMLRLEETSFLSTGAQIQSSDNTMENVKISVQSEAPSLKNEVRAELKFHPFNHKYTLLDDSIYSITLYKSSLDKITELRRGSGFEVRNRDSSFHPFSKKFEINDHSKIKKVF